MSNSLWNARVDLAAAHRMAVFDGLNEGTWTHFSAVVPGQPDQMLISPEYCHWSQVTASSLDLMNPAGEVSTGKRRLDPAAFAIHFPVHASRADAVCVLHSHAPYSTALGMIEDGELLMADQNALGLYGRIGYYDYDGLIFETGHGQRLADELADKRILILRGHGVLVVGPSIAEAYTDLYQLERACAVQCHAMSMGRPIKPIPRDIALSVVGSGEYSTEYKHAHFAGMRRLLDAHQPDYAN